MFLLGHEMIHMKNLSKRGWKGQVYSHCSTEASFLLANIKMGEAILLSPPAYHISILSTPQSQAINQTCIICLAPSSLKFYSASWPDVVKLHRRQRQAPVMQLLHFCWGASGLPRLPRVCTRPPRFESCRTSHKHKRWGQSDR